MNFLILYLYIGLISQFVTLCYCEGHINDKYPYESLQCYSSYTKPDLKLICPEARSNYCVKEVVDLQQNLCGATQYFGDIYDGKLCYLKKCSATCIPGNYYFTFEGLNYTRTRYCCSTNFCNAGVSSVFTNLYLLLICILACIICIYYM